MKIFLKVISVFFLLLMAFYFIRNIDSKEMTTKQKILKAFYPLTTLFSGKKNLSAGDKKPVTSFYALSATGNNGTMFRFSELEGKNVLIVNTASDCGYTAQYEELQKLYERYNDRLVVIAFPANDFKEQEKADDAAIADFCKLNYGVQFPLMKKSIVIKGDQQNEVFQWLTDKNKNGWNDKAPEWNFSKYLVNENGELTGYFSPGVSPLGKEIKQSLEK